MIATEKTCRKGVLLVAVISFAFNVWSTLAFAPSLPEISLASRRRHDGQLFMSASSQNKIYPALSRDEVEAMLDTVPVYAVTEPKQQGLVLLKEKDNTNDIAYFFFSPETANSVFSSIRQTRQVNDEGNTWDISQYPLGLVWFELFKNPEPGIEYRLVPDSKELFGARNLIEQQQAQRPEGTILPEKAFETAHNEVPVFMDQFLRVQTEKDEKVPMYFGLQDLVSTCQQASETSSKIYQAVVNVSDLETLVGQMQQESENDFRKAVFIPPSLQKADPRNAIQSSLDDEDEFTTPTASNDWDD